MPEQGIELKIHNCPVCHNTDFKEEDKRLDEVDSEKTKGFLGIKWGISRTFGYECNVCGYSVHLSETSSKYKNRVWVSIAAGMAIVLFLMLLVAA